MQLSDQAPELVRTALWGAVLLLAIGYALFWLWKVQRGSPTEAARDAETSVPTLFGLTIGLVTNFFDTLGIGSYATTTSVYKLRKVVPDRIIPGTMSVGHSLPTMLEALIYLSIVQVGIKVLLLMIGSSVAGAWLGAGVVAAWPKRKVQLGMGIALMVAATLMFMTQLGLFPGGGDALSIDGPRLWIAVIANFVLGAFMTVGIGLYAPCMIMVALLGMNPKAAFPIMMGSCAFLMPIASIRFIQKGSYNLRSALGLLIGGLPGVVLAAYIVKSLPLTSVRWLVVVVVLYAATSLLRSARQDGPIEELSLSPSNQS